MPSTFTTVYNFEKPADGEEDGIWGDTVNANTDKTEAALVSVSTGRRIGTQRFRTVGTFTYYPTAGTKLVRVHVLGGGGGGGGCAGSGSGGNSGAGGGGGSGGYTYEELILANLPNPITVTVGAGGTGSYGNNIGASGGASSFGSAGLYVVSVAGGTGGIGSAIAASTSVTPGGSGGAITATQNRIYGAPGQPGGSAFSSGTGTVLSGVGGSGPWGGGASAVGVGVNLNGQSGLPGTGDGAGGSGATSSGNVQASPGYVGGNGQNGCVVVEEVS